MRWPQWKRMIKGLLALTLCTIASSANAFVDDLVDALDIERHELGGWVTDIVGGKISKNPESPFTYLIFAQNRAYNRESPLELLNLSSAAYYNFNPKVRVSAGTQMFNMFYPLFNGSRYEYRTFETFEVDLREQSKYFFVSRLEQRALAGDSQIAIRFRERAVVQIPFGKKSLVLYDEIFFNFNNPNWVNKEFFQQNRVFVGLQFQMSDRVALLVGYMNRYIAVRQNFISMDHLLTVDLMFMKDFYYW